MRWLRARNSSDSLFVIVALSFQAKANDNKGVQLSLPHGNMCRLLHIIFLHF